MAHPEVTIAIDAEGHLQVTSNVQDVLMLIGLLEQAKLTVQTRPVQQSPLVSPLLNGGRGVV